MEENKPRYNLKVIVQETGLKPDTLRAWERRYGLPSPQRTEGGHRLYSQRDLATVQWLLARRDEGLSISRAVQLWRDISKSGRDPLHEAQAPAPPPPGETAPASAAADLAALRARWLRACLNFDELEAERIVGLALARHAPELVCLELLQKGLAEIGQLWYEGEATVQQEHYVSALAYRHANALMKAAPPPVHTQRIYLACPPGEEHSFPLLLLALLLRYRGWPVVYLGANVPLAQLGHALDMGRPALVALSAQTLPAAAAALQMARFLHNRQLPLAYGGQIFSRLPALRQTMPGRYLGDSLEDATANVAEILTAHLPMPPGEEPPAVYRQALDCYERGLPLLEWHLQRILGAEQWAKNHLQDANLHLSQNIRAALAFGDMSLLDQEIEWARGMLANSGRFDERALERYLSAYAQAACEQLDEACRPVIDWLCS